MKIVCVFIFTILAASSLAEDVSSDEFWRDLDMTKVIPVQQIPGFWDGRDPALRPVQTDTKSRNPRIVGGQESVPHSHPYIVLLLPRFPTFVSLCGGSTIGPRTVLTAAHCIIGTQDTQVVFGAHNRNVNEPTQHRQVVPTSLYRLHQQYNPNNLNNDIAIMITTQNIPLTSPHITMSVLPPLGNTELFTGELATVSGWGVVCDGCGSSNVLRVVSNNVITNALCSQTFGSFIIHSTLCVASTGGRGSCTGDSGGPLTVTRGSQRWQIGIVSFGSPQCEGGTPGAYARVTSFLPWIESNRHP